jgi:hypothetical protein
MRACPSVVADQQHALFNNSHGHNAVVFPWDGGNQKKIFLKVNIYIIWFLCSFNVLKSLLSVTAFMEF